MTRWRVTWASTAQSYYKRMGREYQEKVREAVKELETGPLSPKNVNRLHGELEGLYRYRVGKFRMIFRVLKEDGEVRILAIASRGDIYK